jgi:hypothetical protein
MKLKRYVWVPYLFGRFGGGFSYVVEIITDDMDLINYHYHGQGD